jgi:hypothetical protein
MRVARHFFPLFFSLLLICAIQSGGAEDDDAPQLQLAPATSNQEAAAQQALQGCNPSNNIQEGLNKNGVYTLIGDIFKTGEAVAFINGTDGVIICKWQNHQWKAISFLNADTVWKYPGWDMQTAKSREPSAEKPFWVVQLQKQPLLVIASDVEKAGQSYYAVLFDKSVEHIVDFTTSFGSSPFVMEDYLITMDQSRGKAIWSGVDYSRIQGNKLKVLTSWGEYCPYDQPDSDQYTCNTLSARGESFTIMDDYHEKQHPADLVIYEGDVMDKDAGSWKAIADAWQNYAVYAKLFIRWARPENTLPSDEPSVEELAYIFEKLSGLPRRLYSPGNDYTRDYNSTPRGKLETNARIQIFGSKKAVNTLAPTNSK